MLPAILAAIATISTIGKMKQETEGATEDVEALNLQAAQQQMKFQQESLANYSDIQQMIQMQKVQAATRGIGADSASLNAIERNTLNIGAKKQRTLDTEESIFNRNIQVEGHKVRSKLYSQLFGDVVNTATSWASIASNAPAKA